MRTARFGWFGVMGVLGALALAGCDPAEREFGPAGSTTDADTDTDITVEYPLDPRDDTTDTDPQDPSADDTDPEESDEISGDEEDNATDAGAPGSEMDVTNEGAPSSETDGGQITDEGGEVATDENGADDDETNESEEPGTDAQTNEPPSEATDPEDPQEPAVPAQPKLAKVELALTDVTLRSLDESVSFEVWCTLGNGLVESCVDAAVIELSNPEVASATDDGQLVPITNGTTSIVASVTGVHSDSVELTVDLGPICTALHINGETSAAAGTSVPLSATCDYDDGRTGVDVTDMVQWSSGSESVATITELGVVAAHGVGSTTITATLDNPDATTASLSRGFAVTEGQLIGITISPEGTSEVPAGVTSVFSADCEFTDVTIDCTSAVDWSTESASIATIVGGTATGHSTGTTNVVASLDGVTSPPVPLTVTAAVLVSIAVTPKLTLELDVNARRQLEAACLMSNGTSTRCTRAVSWLSSDTEVVALKDTGGLFGLDVGTSLVSANLSGITSNSLTVTVVPPTGCESELNFPDIALEASIRRDISKPSGPIYYEDVKSLTRFEHWTMNGQVDDLTGLRCLTGLVDLSIQESTYDDMSEVTWLVRLERVSVRWTNVAMVPDLTRLSRLNNLDLVGTAITDIANIANTSHLGDGGIVNVQNTSLNCDDEWILDQIRTLSARGVTVYSFCSI